MSSLMTEYFFTDDSWWDSIGCDCCDPTLMECYNSDDTDCRLGSAHSIEDCYVQAIITNIGYGAMHEADVDELYSSSLECLEKKAEDLGIVVVIE